MHPAKGQHTAPCRWAEHEVPIAHRACNTNRRIHYHDPDLGRLFIRVAAQPLPSLEPGAAVASPTPVEQYRAGCAPPVTEGAAFDRTTQIG
jgi:hypothetical protein